VRLAGLVGGLVGRVGIPGSALVAYRVARGLGRSGRLDGDAPKPGPRSGSRGRYSVGSSSVVRSFVKGAGLIGRGV